MKILFLHHNYPGQFKNLIRGLSGNRNIDLLFISDNENAKAIEGSRHLCSKFKAPKDKKKKGKSIGISEIHTEQLLRGLAYRNIFEELKKRRWIPQVIVCHTGWGCGIYAREIFTKSKIISYSEWWFKEDSAEYDYHKESRWISYTNSHKRELFLRNTTSAIEIANSNELIAPTQWQRNHLPVYLRERCKVIHDGTDIQYFRPNVEWKKKDRLIVTYAARGLEPMRGIDIFVQLAKKICTVDDRIQIYIIGDNKVNYGSNEIPSGGFGAWAQNELKDLSNKGQVIFKPRLNSKQYARLLKMSDLHFYLTRPFICSWSLLDAMSSGCNLVCLDNGVCQEIVSKESTVWIDPNLNDLSINKIFRKLCEMLKMMDDQVMPNHWRIDINQRKIVEQNYSIPQSIDLWKKVIGIS